MNRFIIVSMFTLACSGGGIADIATNPSGNSPPVHRPSSSTPWKNPLVTSLAPDAGQPAQIGQDGVIDDDAGIPPQYDGGQPDADVVTLDADISSNQPDTGSNCSSPAAVSSDSGNWFTTNIDNGEWFQLVTVAGFSSDLCTYTGKIKWFYDVGGFWESDRAYDQPTTTFVFEFNVDGTMKTRIVHSPNYPNGMYTQSNVSYRGSCITGLSEGDPIVFNNDFRFHSCIERMYSGHAEHWFSVFRGRWNVDHPENVQTIITYPQG